MTAKVDELKAGEDSKEADDEEPAINVTKHTSLVESSGEDQVEVQIVNGDAHLYQGAKSFEDLGLSQDLLKGIYAMGFQKPSKIQEKALPLLLASPPMNMVGQSQAGTGKTAAFALTMLSRCDFSLNEVQAICLAPARELARQILDNVKVMGKYTGVTTQLVVKDSIERNQRVNAHILVGTPGTMLGLIKKRQINASKVKIFVLDEADNMLDLQGLGDDSLRIKK